MSELQTINVITTMHRGGYEHYGREMIRAFLRYWPDTIRLTLYTEGFVPDEKSERVEVLDLHATCPDLVAFKEANKEPWQNGRTGSSAARDARVKLVDKYNFKFDAVKFANKVFAYCKQAARTNARYLVWLDADTVTLKPIPADFIPSLGNEFLLYLGRRFTHSECGFMRFDMSHPGATEFFRIMQAMYETGELFTLNEWHDSFVFDAVRTVLCAAGTIQARSISSTDISRHPFINSVLGTYMDHLKGDQRKARGSSTLRDRGLEPLSQKILRKLGLAKEA